MSKQQQQKETKLGTNTGSFPDYDFQVRTESSEGGSAAPEYDFLNVDEQTGLVIVCKTCQKSIFDIRKHRNPKGQCDDDDDRVSTLPPPECGRDDGPLSRCNRCGDYVLPGSNHHDDLSYPCNSSVFAFSRRAEGSFAFSGKAVIAEHQEGGSTFDDEEPVYSPEHRGYPMNCSICGCVVYHRFGDVEAYYCPKHNKYDRAWQD